MAVAVARMLRAGSTIGRLVLKRFFVSMEYFAADAANESACAFAWFFLYFRALSAIFYVFCFCVSFSGMIDLLYCISIFHVYLKTLNSESLS